MSIAVANWVEKDARNEIHRLVDEIRDKGFFIPSNSTRSGSRRQEVSQVANKEFRNQINEKRKISRGE